MKNFEDYEKWYQENHPFYTQLSNKVEAIIKELLGINNINYHDIRSRTKSIESFVSKLKPNINYDPKDMQDLSGIRIIAYFPSDVNKIGDIIEKCFTIDKKRSSDKATLLGTSRVGYHSVHYVARLTEERTTLPEFTKFKNLHFEIQVRTILQHAWAEIEHDRSYKFSGILPSNLERRLMLVSGLLEVADNEFNSIAKEVEEYSLEVSKKTKKGDLE